MQEENFTERIFPLRLREAMDRRPWKQKELADAAGIAQSAISNYLKGIRMPGSIELLRLARVLKVPMEDLLSADRADVQTVSEEEQAAYGDSWRARALAAEATLQAIRAAMDSSRAKF